jgi:FixJ family two-component response regulator
VHEFSPDLALIDLRLGTEDGRETAKLLTASNPSLKIVFMTGFADSLLAIRNEGRYKVLKKPFQIESFISIIQREVAK